MNITSELYSLERIVQESPQWEFKVPLYQRLYVWNEQQVETLLADLCNAYERSDPLFYLGGTLLVEQDETGNRRFDLVDGQQRFTTLWLLCHAWGGSLDPFLRVAEGDEWRPRVEFAIRPEVNRFMNDLIHGGHGEIASDAQAGRRMRTALDLMAKCIAERAGQSQQDYQNGLADYVFRRVKFVITAVPRATDLNKLFEVINNRGVQLQHHEVLKARLLKKLNESDRSIYAQLWDACADMNAFIEDALCGVSGMSKAAVTALYEAGGLSSPDKVRQALSGRAGGHHLDGAQSLADVLAQGPLATEAAGEAAAGDGETGVRSIIGFPLFLQHVLRVWLFERQRPGLPRVLDRELLKLFQDHLPDASTTEHDVREFIDLLWRIRVLFDRHVIKWIDQGEEEIHMICRINVSASKGVRYMSRSRDTDTSRGMALLQGMLYHSQEITTHYWLTPLLAHMHRDESEGDEGIYLYLRHLDNHLLGSGEGEALAERSLSFMRDPWQSRALVHEAELRQAKGTGFAHYWFYKLEFVLWHQQVRDSQAWRDFRMTAKSSVEHISPQTPTEHDENRVDTALDRFGNLALVSRSINSEYGNLPFNEKRQRFHNRNAKKLDSLKMALIYENHSWSDEKAFEHEAGMVEWMNRYCESVEAEVRIRERT